MNKNRSPFWFELYILLILCKLFRTENPELIVWIWLWEIASVVSIPVTLEVIEQLLI